MDEMERWADMPGFPGYRIGCFGHAYRVMPGGARERIKPIIQGGRLYYRMRRGCRRSMMLVERAVAETFLQPVPLGYGIRHIDGDPLNCRADNLELAPRMSAGYRICKIDAQGRALEEYTSAKEAARRNFMTYQTVLNRCRGVTRDNFEHDKFSFRFAEDLREGGV